MALSLSLAATLPAQAAEPVTRDQVLEAIRTFESKAQGRIAGSGNTADDSAAVARASNTIFNFSVESDDVVVDMGADSVPWCDLKKGVAGQPNSDARVLLFAAYLSGCVKAQLDSGKHDPSPFRGWVNMLRVYRTIKVREGITIPEVDQLLALEMKGSLEAFAAEAVKRSTESLRKTYGSPSDGARQMVASADRP